MGRSTSREGDNKQMKTIIITAIICLTLVMISWINKDKKK